MTALVIPVIVFSIIMLGFGWGFCETYKEMKSLNKADKRYRGGKCTYSTTDVFSKKK